MDAALANKHILIVDDTMSIRHLIRTSLRAHGFNNIVEAGDGLSAFKVLQRGEVELVISDWEMPKMDGIELFENILNDSKCKNTPFILLTKHGGKEKVTEAISKGIKNYIVKPFTPEVVINKVIEVLQ